MTEQARRILIYRLGSLGDTVVALPALHLVKRAFPNGEFRALTNVPVNAKGPAMAAVLGDSGLVHGYFRYPLGTRSPVEIWRLTREIRHWRPDVAVYLAAPRGRAAAVRDVAFLRACGARTIVGAPLEASSQAYQYDERTARWESEAARLGRCLRKLGDARIDRPESWDLRLSSDERAAGLAMLGPLANRPFLVISAGGKTSVQDWGERNWLIALRQLTAAHNNIGLLAVGAADEFARCERLGKVWRGPTLNLCGRASPRVAAAAMRHGVGFVGHDSGPLHLAAAVGLPCVGVFSSRNPRGIWFPPGTQHTIFDTDIECAGCRLSECLDRGKACILAVSPGPVVSAVGDLLEAFDCGLAAATVGA